VHATTWPSGSWCGQFVKHTARAGRHAILRADVSRNASSSAVPDRERRPGLFRRLPSLQSPRGRGRTMLNQLGACRSSALRAKILSASTSGTTIQATCISLLSGTWFQLRCSQKLSGSLGPNRWHHQHLSESRGPQARCCGGDGRHRMGRCRPGPSEEALSHMTGLVPHPGHLRRCSTHSCRLFPSQ
jgi:hypothetical protein